MPIAFDPSCILAGLVKESSPDMLPEFYMPIAKGGFLPGTWSISGDFINSMSYVINPFIIQLSKTLAAGHRRTPKFLRSARYDTREKQYEIKRLLALRKIIDT